MTEFGTVTVWLYRLKAGDRGSPVEKLWKAYFGRLVTLARVSLRGRARVITDEEDIALSAIDSFVRAAEADRFPRLADRDDLWRVLFAITVRKAADAVQAEGRLKRGAGRVVSLDSPPGDHPDREWPVPTADPDPAEAAAVADALTHLLGSLQQPILRQIAELKMQGYTNAEIADRIERSEPTVERKLKLIRGLWARAGGS